MDDAHRMLRELQQRTRTLEKRLRITQGIAALVAAAAVAYAFAAPAEARGTPEPQVLTVRGLIVVDADGRQRIAIGAPWPDLEGRRSPARGVGMLIVDSAGVDRINVASPAPDPPGGRRIAPANGLTFYDPRGNERGGVGYLDNGRSVLVLDNDGGEGAAVFSFDNGHVGVGLMREGRFRGLLDFDPETRATRLALSDSVGRPRARLTVSGSGAPAWEILDEEGVARPGPRP